MCLCTWTSGITWQPTPGVNLQCSSMRCKCINARAKQSDAIHSTDYEGSNPSHSTNI